jgi:hypothetical protein
MNGEHPAVIRQAGLQSERNKGPKYVLSAALGALTIFVRWNNERFCFNRAAPEWAHYNPVPWHLLPHGLGGAIALVLGAMQFPTRLLADHVLQCSKRAGPGSGANGGDGRSLETL